MTANIISNKKIDDIMKTVKTLDESSLLIKGVSETVINESKVQKGAFIGMLFGRLATSLLRKMLAFKRVVRGGDGVIQAGEGQDV